MEAYLTERVRAALAALDGLPDGFDPAAVAVEWAAPKDPAHGDLATNVALQLARSLGRQPRAIAQAIAGGLHTDPARVATVEVAGPGFLNVRFGTGYLAKGLADVLAASERWGHTDDQTGKTAIVEYVSANPTGPLTVGHGRNAVLGDTFANLLAAVGYKVTREYYFNDAGRQMRVLGESVRARYEESIYREYKLYGTKYSPFDVKRGRFIKSKLNSILHNYSLKKLPDGRTVPASFPNDGYQGGYIGEIARSILNDFGPIMLLIPEVDFFIEYAQNVIFKDINITLKRLGVNIDSYFNERDLYDTNDIGDVVQRLKALDLAYEHDGATWFKTSILGKVTSNEDGTKVGQDVVLVKSSGEPTYRLPDIAYHLDKLARGFDLVLDVFGADHIATYPDVLRGVEALGGDVGKIQVVVYQFVTLVRGGAPVKMSTRKATYVTLDELMDEVGEDVARFFFLMRSPNTHLEFDLDLAKEASEKNPVFYLQYAHARVASIRRKAAEAGLERGEAPDLSLLRHPSEAALTKAVLAFPDEVRAAAEAMAPHRLAGFLREVATAFSLFYRDCRIVGEAPALAAARLALAEAAQTTLANGLALLGVSAPDRMDRAEPAA